MLLTNEEHCEYLLKAILEGPELVYFSSYGVYAGITTAGEDSIQWGSRYASKTRNVLEAMRPLKESRLLIGIPDYKSCSGIRRCLYREKQYAGNLLTILNHAEHFPEFDWRITNSLHIKCYLFFYKGRAKGLAGSRNLTNSGWEDVTFELDEKQTLKLFDHTKQLWDRSRKTSVELLEEIMEEQNISKRGLEAVLKEF